MRGAAKKDQSGRFRDSADGHEICRVLPSSAMQREVTSSVTGRPSPTSSSPQARQKIIASLRQQQLRHISIRLDSVSVVRNARQRCRRHEPAENRAYAIAERDKGEKELGGHLRAIVEQESDRESRRERDMVPFHRHGSPALFLGLGRAAAIRSVTSEIRRDEHARAICALFWLRRGLPRSIDTLMRTGMTSKLCPVPEVSRPHTPSYTYMHCTDMYRLSMGE